MQSMQFRISGRVYEEESGLGVPGLLIRAYDKDLLYDDLLGTAITDAEGRFELCYAESDFKELFDRQPDIYLSIYATPCRFLIDTKEAIRWDASRDETFEVAIKRKALGDCAPTRPDNQVESGIALPKGSLKIERRGGFDVPRIPGFATTGTPGAPAVPHQMRYVALPLGGDVLKFEVIPGEAVRLTGPFNPLPAQEPFPDVGTDPKTGDGFSVENVNFQMTPPDPRYFEGRKPYPASLAELVKVEEVGPLQIAAVEVRPVQYEPATRSFLFYPRLKYVITFDREKARRVAEDRRASKTKIGELYAEHLNSFLQTDRVAVARDVFWPGFVFVLEDAPHVIITDNFQWPESVPRGDGTTRPPTLAERGAALDGDLVAEFKRLAVWRTSHGIRSRVVRISEIVDGKFGDFTEGGFARDLAEVIRNFLKFVQANWDTLYVVLGGDVNVVPMRRLTGAGRYHTFGVKRIGDNPPPVKRSRFLAGHAACKLHPDFMPNINEPLSTYHGGVRVPYQREAGPGQLGWYFTNEASFNNMSEGFARLPDAEPTSFVIVEGPESVINDDFYWLRDVNSIPSDFYYASLVGPGYSVPGKHDFDDNNNGLYGQSHWDDALGREVTLDEVDFNSDVWVGRVPAESAAQVKAFVDKVLTYEGLRTPGRFFAEVDTAYLRKVLYAADYWGREFQDRQDDTSTAPAESMFTHVDGTTTTKVRTKFDLQLVSGNPSYRLVGRTGTSQTVIPYNTSASATSAGWFFATSSSYATQSATPTRFVKVRGPEATINPVDFFWDPVGLELAMSEKETLRGMMDNWFPAFDNVQRHYADYFDLAAPPPVTQLVNTTVRNAINTGQHFLSLTGHGSWGGCCAIKINTQPDFTNSHQYFIAFADSCSTGRPDGVDSLAEVSVIDADGGAVAYVGNTRYSWIGTGDNYEQMFWCLLEADGRVGPAAGLRLATDGVRSIWTFYAQTLYGDPAMRIWDRVPAVLSVTHPEIFLERNFIPFTVNLRGEPLRDARVTLTGGEGERAVFQSKKTSPDGRASFTLPPGADQLGALEVTVWSREGQLYRALIRNGEETPQ